MEVSKIEFIGKVCEHRRDGEMLDYCRTGINDGCVSSKHPGMELITLRLWVDRDHFSRPLDILPEGNYKVVIEKIEDTNAG